MIKKRITCLITGSLDIMNSSGGTLSVLTILKKLSQDGFDVSCLWLADKGFNHERVAGDVLKRGGRVVRTGESGITFYLNGFPYPFEAHFSGINIISAYRQNIKDVFDDVLNLWGGILASGKTDASLTLNSDIFSMQACLNFSPLRLHRISDQQILENGFNPYFEMFKDSAPGFKFICTGNFLKHKFRSFYDRDSINLIPQIDLEGFADIGAPGEYITMINATPAKGLAIFLNIASNLRDKKFLLIMKPGNQINPEGFNLPNVTFMPWDMNVRRIYEMTRILLVPSLWEEPYSRVVVEGICCGLPVIANDSGGIKEEIPPDGFLVKVNEDSRKAPDFFVNVKYHARTIMQYIRHIRCLDDPVNYDKAALISKAAASAAFEKQEASYSAFRDWLHALI